MATDASVLGQKFEFPECWNNDLKMSALFAPFRSKSVNPTDWDSKMKFWSNLIENWCKFNKSPTIETSSLKNSFSRKGLPPACLEEVIQHLNSSGILVNKVNFMMPDENWKNWAISLVTNPLKWTYNTVKSTLIKTEEKEVCFIHLPVVEHLSEELLKTTSGSSNGKINSFGDLLQLGFESPENLSIVLHWMQKQGQAATCEINGVTLVKLSRNKKTPVKITENDLTSYRLEKLEKILEENIAKLYEERDAALDNAKKHLTNKMKEMAKISLRRKKNIEKTIKKQAVNLENIQAISHQIEQAKLDNSVYESYQKGVTALREIYKEARLNAEDVTVTLDELAEVLNRGKEIGEALAGPLDPTAEESIEDELNALLLADAPDVPEDKLPVADDQKTGGKDTTEKVRTRLEALSI